MNFRMDLATFELLLHLFFSLTMSYTKNQQSCEFLFKMVAVTPSILAPTGLIQPLHQRDQGPERQSTSCEQREMKWPTCRATRYWTREIITLQRSNELELTHVLSSQKGSKTNDHQIEILRSWESSFNWGLGGGGEPGSTPSGHSGEIALPYAPVADSALAQVVNQRFRPWFNSSHTNNIMIFTCCCRQLGIKTFNS